MPPARERKKKAMIKFIGKRKGRTCQWKYVSSVARTRSRPEKKVCVFSSEALVLSHTVFQSLKK